MVLHIADKTTCYHQKDSVCNSCIREVVICFLVGRFNMSHFSSWTEEQKQVLHVTVDLNVVESILSATVESPFINYKSNLCFSFFYRFTNRKRKLLVNTCCASVGNVSSRRKNCLAIKRFVGNHFPVHIITKSN